MKYTSEHYPNSGIQHTRAVVALTTATLCIELYKGKTMAELLEIQECIKKCSSLTKKKKLSAGANRDLANCSVIMCRYIEKLQASTGNTIFCKWAALLWTALIFVEDVINTCPQYTTGIEAKKWANLQTALDKLTTELKKEAPNMDSDGTYIYEQGAWALDGILFKDSERESELC